MDIIINNPNNCFICGRYIDKKIFIELGEEYEEKLLINMGWYYVYKDNNYSHIIICNNCCTKNKVKLECHYCDKILRIKTFLSHYKSKKHKENMNNVNKL